MVSFGRSICIWAKKIESKYKLNRLLYKWCNFSIQLYFKLGRYILHSEVRFLNSKILSERKQLSLVKMKPTNINDETKLEVVCLQLQKKIFKKKLCIWRSNKKLEINLIDSSCSRSQQTKQAWLILPNFLTLFWSPTTTGDHSYIT